MARSEKIRRKDLREPDEFITLSRQAVAFAEDNRTALLMALGAVILVLIAVIAYRAISANRTARAEEAYQAAHQLLADKKYPEAATAYQTLADSYGSTQYAALAQLQAGHALLLGGRPGEAALAYQRFIDGGPPTDYLRQFAFTRLGYALEQDGKIAEARTAFGAAALQAGPFAEEALDGEARTAEAAGDGARAKELYEQLLEKYPTSDRRERVMARLVKLGWSPPRKADDDKGTVPSTEGHAAE